MFVGPDVAPLEVRLKEGRTLRVRVVDKDDKPIPGVGISPDTWRGHRTLDPEMGLPERTDEGGNWVWNWAPEDEIQSLVLKSGFMQIRGKVMTPREEPYVLTMYPPLVVSGRVVDAETNEPLKSFRVVRGSQTDGKIYWRRPSNLEGKNGSFRVTSTEPRSVHLISIEADGYLPSVSRPIQNDEGQVGIDFELRKGEGPTGIVLLPDGKPAQGALAVLATPSTRVWFRDGLRLAGTRPPQVQTKSDGRFSFAPQTEPFAVVAVHQQGVTIVDRKALESSAEIKLQPWARVEGTLHIGRKVGAQQLVSASRRESAGGHRCPDPVQLRRHDR